MAVNDGDFSVYTVLASQLTGVESRITKRLDAIAAVQLDYVTRIAKLESLVLAIEKDAIEQKDDRKWMKRMVISAVVTALILPLMVGLVLAVVLAT